MSKRGGWVAGMALLAAATLAGAKEPEALVSFSGGIGVEPLTAAGGAHVTNTVRGVAPGGRLWVIRKLSASVGTDGSIVAKGRGLLFGSGDLIGTVGAVTAVSASLFCGPADATALRFDAPSAALSATGDFSIKGVLTQDGINAAVMPPECANPVLLIRNFNTTTGARGGWFAAGIPGGSDD